MAKVVVSVQVEPETRDELERRAAADDRTISYVLRRAVAQYLEHEDTPPIAMARAASFDAHGEGAARP